MFFSKTAEQAGGWQPLIDVYRTLSGWLLKVDLAGVEPKDVTLELKGRCLRIRGQRRDWCLEEGCHFFRMEIAYSHFERLIELPDNLDQASITSEFQHGMLLIRITTRTER